MFFFFVICIAIYVVKLLLKPKCYVGHIVNISVAILYTGFMVYLAQHTAHIPICMLTLSFRIFLTHKKLNYVDKINASLYTQFSRNIVCKFKYTH